MDPFRTKKRRVAKQILWKLKGANSRARRTLRRKPDWKYLPLSTLVRLALTVEPALNTKEDRDANPR